MAQITAGMVRELRERTGLGMMDCKKALVETGGEIERAIAHLRKVGGLKAAKKAERVAAQGVVLSRLAEDGSRGVLVEVNCETDFVARDENFLAFADQCLVAAFAEPSANVAGLLAGGLEDQREKLVQKIGENVNLRRVEHLAAGAGGRVGNYVHGNHKIAVLVSLTGGDEELARDVAMHVAAMNPLVVRGDDVPEDVLARESEIYSAQARESGKPEAIIEKMISGRLRKFVAEVSLLQQAFVKNPESTVGELVRAGGAEVSRMLRFAAGEGIEKKEEDFAAEVAAQAGAG